MYKVGLVTFKSGVLSARDFTTKSQAEDYILEMVDKEGVKTGYLENTETKEREKIEEMR